MQSRPSPSALRTAELSQSAATPFELRPDAARCSEIARDLDLQALRKLSFVGTVAPEGNADWRLDAKLGATVVQPCSVTLAPVTTRIDVPVTRRFTRTVTGADAIEAEMPEDDTEEPLGAWIEPEAVMLEALALAVPLYPRAPGAALDAAAFSEPGVTPMRDEDARPFAGLKSLRDQLKASDETGE